MAERHVVTALIEKRLQLAGQIEHLQDQVCQAVIALDNVEPCLRIFSPDIDLGPVRAKPVPPPHQAFKGEVARVVLSTLCRPSASASCRAARSTPTSPAPGTTCKGTMGLSASITASPTQTTSAGVNLAPTPAKWRGARTTAGCRTVSCTSTSKPP